MKVFISVDLEGVAGIAEDIEVDVLAGGQLYDEARRLMTAECNAAIEAAFSSGADEVVVNDSHWLMLNLLQRELDPRAEVVRGNKKPHDMLEGLDSETSAALFVGYHAGAGHDDGVLNHTMEDTVQQVLINGAPAGETRLNAALAGTFGVPVVFVSGDDVLCAEARDLLGDVETAQVKRAVHKYTARSVHPIKAQGLIADGVRRALGRLADFAPYRVEPPVTMRLDLISTSMAALCSWVPGVRRVGSRAVEYRSDDYFEVYRMLEVLLLLAGTIESGK